MTDEQIADIAESCGAVDPADSFWRAFARAVIAGASMPAPDPAAFKCWHCGAVHPSGRIEAGLGA